jgi:hypothetical protein
MTGSKSPSKASECLIRDSITEFSTKASYPPSEPAAGILDSAVQVLVEDLKRTNPKFVRDLRASAHGAIAQICVRYLWSKLLVFAACDLKKSEPAAEWTNSATSLEPVDLAKELRRTLDGLEQRELAGALGGFDRGNLSKILTCLDTGSSGPLECPSLQRLFGYIVESGREWAAFDCIPDLSQLRLAAWSAAITFADGQLASLDGRTNYIDKTATFSDADLSALSAHVSPRSDAAPSVDSARVWKRWGRAFLVTRAVIGLRKGP